MYGGYEKESVFESKKDCYTILVFPDYIIYKNISEENLENFSNYLFNKTENNSTIINSFESYSISNFFSKGIILCCTHKKRDKRCGVIGNVVKY